MAKATLYHPCFQCHRLLWDPFVFGSYKRQCVVDWFPVNLCCYDESQACALTALSGPMFVFAVGGKGCCVWQTGKLLTIPVAKPCGVWAYKDLGAPLVPRSYLIEFWIVYQPFFIQVQGFIPSKANLWITLHCSIHFSEKMSNRFCANASIEPLRECRHARVSLWPLVAVKAGVHCINYCWSKRSCSGLCFSSHNLLKKTTIERGVQ